MEWQTMTAKQLAERMNGREYMNEITPDEEREAYYNRLVAVYGYSDDCLEFAGYIDDEVGAFEGTKVYVLGDGTVDKYKLNDNAITALWDACTAEGERAEWVIETDIPHETFKIYEDGELFCVGIVFCVDDLTLKMDSVSELDKAIQFLREQYERAQRIDAINNPLAWALYQTWRHVDEPPKEQKKRIKDHVCNNDYCELE